MAPPVLIVGCGYLGSRAAQSWRSAGRDVAALTRGRADALSAEGVHPVVGDVLDPASLRRLPDAGTVLYAVGMDRSAGRSMREVYVDGVRNVARELAGRCGRFVYVSSTGVYGQTDGSWVDADSPTDPVDESGRVVLDAERALREIVPAAVVLRFAGIYGPGRVLRREALLRGEPLAADADKWLNLIHVDDGAAAVLAAEAHAKPGDTFVVADGTPVTRRDFYTESARLLGAPPAAFAEVPPKAEPNRRADSAKLRALGWAPAYPSYREGLRASVGVT